MTTDRYAALRAALPGVNERSEEIGEDAWYTGSDLFYKDSIVNAHVRIDSREGAYIAKCDPETIAALLADFDMEKSRAGSLADQVRHDYQQVAALLAERDALRDAVAGLLNALPSATTHPAISAARAALAAQERT